MIDQLSKRAQQIALHSLDQLDNDAQLYKESLPDQCLFCFLIAKEEASKGTTR
jgi:hypothetical protein